MDDSDFDELVESMKRRHNPPPPAPRDRLWSRIEAARTGRRGQAAPPPRRRAGWAWWQAGLAAAAVLALGILIGRLGGRPDAGPHLAAGPGDRPGQEAPIDAGPPDDPVVDPLVRHAATDLYRRADVLLTGLRTADCDGGGAAPLPAWAGGMLAQTRLLLDTDLARDPETRALLRDLELVLARIAGISATDCAADVESIRRDRKTRTTLDRLRVAAADRIDPRSL